ncbi:MAG TPA: TIR domain-containing protein [Pyrinomonadaceae bacterium]|nr:TIR domain-containing protein [Pyrinomonadaceae bacterium]
MEAERPKRSTVFISYSHQDAEWLARLRIHLRPLEREEKVEIWDDTKITTGTEWNEEIRKALSLTKVAVLLISADFLASDFIAADELPPLLLAAKEDGAKILPLILSPSRFLQTRNLAQFQAANDPAKPLIGLTKAEQENILVRLSIDIEGYLKGLAPEHTTEYYGTQPSAPQQITDDGGRARGAAQPSPTADPPSASKSSTAMQTAARKPGDRQAFPRLPVVAWAAIIIASLAVLTVAYWKFTPGPTPPKINKYSGKIVDEDTQQAIVGAKVSVNTPGVMVNYIASEGVVNLEFPDATTTAHLTIEEPDHETLKKNVTPAKTGMELIPLRPLIEYSCKVIDDKGPVRGATVRVKTEAVEQSFTTEANGNFQLKLRKPINDANVRIEASGHKVFDESVRLSRTGNNDIRIVSIPIRIKNQSISTSKSPNGVTQVGQEVLDDIGSSGKPKPTPHLNHPLRLVPELKAQ